MHTPEEAQGLWCPFARQWSVGVDMSGSGGWNRHPANHPPPSDEYLGDTPVGCRCLADGCSAWRWAETFSVTDRHDAEIAEKFMGKGFCGLAGRP